MKKQLSLLSSSLLILSILIACKKDKVPELVDNNSGTSVNECKDIVFSGGELFDITVTSGVQFSAPTFSPFNDNEFIFIKWENGAQRQLVKYNIQNGSQQVLCSTSDINGFYLGYQAEWGNQNWIVFSAGTGSSGTGFVVKDDGTSLHEFLSPGISFNFPKFNEAGDRILAWGTGVDNTTYPSLPIYNLNGIVVDTFIYGNNNGVNWGYPSENGNNFEQRVMAYWNHNFSPFQKGFCYKSNDTTVQILGTINGGEDWQISAMGKFQDKLYYLIELHGLYSFDLTTNITEILLDICDSRKIRTMSVSPISGNILIEEVKRTKVDEFGGIDEQSNIYQLNPNTGEKTPILVGQ